MVKLVDILKEVLLELADRGNTFEFKKIQDHVFKDKKGRFEGNVYYTFDTDNNLNYEVAIYYLSKDYDEDDYYLLKDNEDDQMIEVSFYVNKEDDEERNSFFDVTNNTKEVYKVMGTIFNCIKDAYEKNPFKFILYDASDTKNFGRSSKGADQRRKLYNYYIKKEFPNAEIRQDSKITIVKLK